MGYDGAQTFFSADTHFGHRLMALQRGHAPRAGSREAVTPEQVRAHDEHVIAAWNSVVGDGDLVWHLGDLTLQHAVEVAHLLDRLQGRIRLVLGNHDRAHPLFGEKAVAAQQDLLRTQVEYVCTAARVTIAGGDAGRIPVRMPHFPYRGTSGDERWFGSWQLEDTGEWLLHGHTHAREATGVDRPRQIHVGWDAWGRPVSEAGILHVMRTNQGS